MKLETRIINAVMLIALMILPLGIVGAIPVQPHKFWGAVTIDGVSAPDGTLVEAKIAGITYESELTVDGRYGWTLSDLFYVPADDTDTDPLEGGVNGDTVEFYVDGVLADSAPFEIGGATNLDLAIIFLSPVYELQLYEGWNLIGIPCIPEDPNIEVMLHDIIDYVESVWAYDGETGWSSYSPYAPSDLTEMVDGKGYWIKMTTDMVWEIEC